MAYTQILYEKRGDITVITFNRPQVHNCVGATAHRELLDAWGRFKNKEAAVRGFGRPLDEGLRIETECFNRSIWQPESAEGLRRFAQRDHPKPNPAIYETQG